MAKLKSSGALIDFFYDYYLYPMNLRFVEAFYWVASLKSVTRAADKLFITQSAMSSRIATLEAELGVLLLDRRDKHFRLTVAGARFLGYAQKLLELQRHLKTEMGAADPFTIGMRIGTIESVLHSWLIPWIGQLRAAHPGLELELTVETTPILVEQVQQGMLDVAFAALPAGGDGVRRVALPAMDMVVVGNASIHRKRRYSMKDLADSDWVTFQRGSQPHVALLDCFRAAELEPRRVHTTSSISAMVQLVQGGFGIATLPRSAVRQLAMVANLRILVTDAVLLPLPIHASYRTDPSSRAVESVVQSASNFVESPSGLKAASKKSMK